mmetsp:Transcript_23484/g.69896  ORF Transcript_23484/g.69896 Transcript_23484/m.69896 type:complete len:261 (+) Transcript_23484:968-1750(+)
MRTRSAWKRQLCTTTSPQSWKALMQSNSPCDFSLSNMGLRRTKTWMACALLAFPPGPFSPCCSRQSLIAALKDSRCILRSVRLSRFPPPFLRSPAFPLVRLSSAMRRPRDLGCGVVLRSSELTLRIMGGGAPPDAYGALGNGLEDIGRLIDVNLSNCWSSKSSSVCDPGAEGFGDARTEGFGIFDGGARRDWLSRPRAGVDAESPSPVSAATERSCRVGVGSRSLGLERGVEPCGGEREREPEGPCSCPDTGIGCGSSDG